MSFGEKMAEKLGLKLHGADVYPTYYLAADIHRLLEGAVTVASYGCRNKWASLQTPNLEAGSLFAEYSSYKDSVEGLIIGIKPIQKDTAESLLREFLAMFEDKGKICSLNLCDRAKALLK